ncbi:MAG: hypothetical protein EBX39_14550, partial [Actinobacteria bacterium]|nr:hypothetical protein [Actinomycetota bacterium]
MYRTPVKTEEEIEMEKAIKASMRHDEEEFNAQLQLALEMSLAPPEEPGMDLHQEPGMDLPDSPRPYLLDPSAGGAYPCGAKFTPSEGYLRDESLCGAKFTPSMDSPPPLVDSPRGLDPEISALIDGVLAGRTQAEVRARQVLKASKDAMAFTSVLDGAPLDQPDDDDDPDYQRALLESPEEQLEIDRLL